jgi:hypothetical protein
MNDEKVSWKRGRDHWNAHAPKPSEYLAHLAALLAARDAPLPVVLYCRVSTPKQKREGNLDTQVQWTTAQLKQLNVDLLATYAEATPAYEDTNEYHPCGEWQPELGTAAKEAQRLGAVLVAACADRFVRNSDWWPTGGPGGGCLPHAADFEELRMWTLGVPLATIYPPRR